MNPVSLRSNYGLSPEDFGKLLTKQGYCCPICGCRLQTNSPKAVNGSRWKTVVDHSHATNQVRGILCRDCNVGLGFFKDKPNRLESAARYLKRYERADSSGEQSEPCNDN